MKIDYHLRVQKRFIQQLNNPTLSNQEHRITGLFHDF